MIIVRDPRDAVVSFMQCFPNSLVVDLEVAPKAFTVGANALRFNGEPMEAAGVSL